MNIQVIKRSKGNGTGHTILGWGDRADDRLLSYPEIKKEEEESWKLQYSETT